MRLKSILLLSVAALPIAVGGCADSATEIRAKYGNQIWTAENVASSPYDRAKQHFNAGRFGLAIDQFEAALGQDPNSVEALNGLAASYDQLQRFRLAERYYLRALNLDPGNAQTLNNMGYSYLMQKRYDLAVAYLKDAVALEPTNAMVQENLQQAQASLELENRDFLASAVGSAEFRDVAAEPRTVNLQSQKAEAPAPSARDVPPTVKIEELSEPDDMWVERSTASVQTLITRPNPDLLTAMLDAGLTPRIANYRNQSAVTMLQTQPAPWRKTNVMVAEAMIEQQLNGAIRQDQLENDLTDAPRAAPTVAVDVAGLPQLSAAVIDEAPAAELSDLPQLSAAVIDPGTVGNVGPDSGVSATADDGWASGSLGDLPQLSAALIEAAGVPAQADAPRAGAEGSAIHAAAVAGDEAVVHSSGRPHDDPPARPLGGDESPVIEVSNGTGRSEMALRVSKFLDSEGLSVKRLTNAEHFSHQETVIFYRPEWLRKAQELAACLPIEVRLEAVPNQTPDIRLRLGGDLLNFDQGLLYAIRESSAQPTG